MHQQLLIATFYDYFNNFFQGLETLMQVVTALFVLAAIAIFIFIVYAAVALVTLVWGLIYTYKQRRDAPTNPVQWAPVQQLGQLGQERILRKDSHGNEVSLHWDEISAVQAIILDRRKTAHWLFIALVNEESGKRIMIPQSDPEARQIYDRICELPGFDRVGLSKAIACTEPQRILLWEARSAQQASGWNSERVK